MVWPQAGGVAHSAPGKAAGLWTVAQAVHEAHEAAVHGDTDTAHAIQRAIVRRWHQ